MTLLAFMVLMAIVRLLVMVSVYILCTYECKNANFAAAVTQVPTLNHQMFIQNDWVQANPFLN